MRLNPTSGAAALGVSTNISIDGVVPAALVGVGAQYPTWIDPAGNVLFYFNVDAGELQTLDLDAGSPVTASAGGANRLASGNSVWVAALNSGSLVGVRSNIAGWDRLPLAGLGDMDEDGRFAVIQAFAADRGVQCFDAAGAQTAIFDVPITPSAVIRCKSGMVAFAGAQWSWQLRALDDGSEVTFAQRVQGVVETVPIALADGSVWVVERVTNPDGLTIRPATGNQGYQIATSLIFNPDVMELTPGVVRIGWSATAGEGPTALRMVDLTLSSGGQTLWTSASGTLVSSTGPTLPLASMPADMSGVGMAALFLDRHPFVDQKGILSERFGWPWVRDVIQALRTPIDLGTQVTGTLGPGNGGTGSNTGTSVINASNVTLGTLPQNVKWSQYDITSTGTVNNLSFASADFLRCDNASALTITGLSAGVPGQRLVIVATDADVTLSDLSGSSVAANQIATFTGADVTIAIDEAAFLEYDGTDGKWRLLFLSSLGAGGDVVGPASSVDEQVALFDGTTGKLIKAATRTGIAYVDSGVLKTCRVSVMTDGDPVSPDLMWDSDGDVIMTTQVL